MRAPLEAGIVIAPIASAELRRADGYCTDDVDAVVALDHLRHRPAADRGLQRFLHLGHRDAEAGHRRPVQVDVQVALPLGRLDLHLGRAGNASG